MPFPFPGIDPFVESQKWIGFHTQFITGLGQTLVSMLRPRYEVDFQDYVYLTDEGEEGDIRAAPDVWFAETQPAPHGAPVTTTGVALATPTVLTMPAMKKVRQPFLLIRTKDGRDVVTVLELLSPWNKAFSEGRAEYLRKRQELLKTGAHLVELDLLRGGQRLPTREPLPAGDYYIYVCRREKRKKVEVYSWHMRDLCPGFLIPLAERDEDLALDLQSVVSETYQRAGYDYTLDYARDVQPPLTESDAAWLRERLSEWSRNRG